MLLFVFQFWAEWKGSRANSTKATSQQLKSWGVTTFMIRLHLSPSEDPRRVVLDLIALPVKSSAMKNLPSYELDKNGAGYPSLLVKEGSKYPTRLIPGVMEETKPFGLPSWPLLLMGKEETVFPGHEKIVHALRKMWHGATLPPIFLTADWWRKTKESKVAASAVPATPEWPLFELERTEEVEGTPGKNIFVFKTGHCGINFFFGF